MRGVVFIQAVTHLYARGGKYIYCVVYSLVDWKKCGKRDTYVGVLN